MILWTLLTLVACGEPGPTPPEERTPLTPGAVMQLIAALDQVESFPVPLANLEADSGVDLDHHLEVSSSMLAQVDGISVLLSGPGYVQVDGEPDLADPLIHNVSITYSGEAIAPPPPSSSAQTVDIGTYTYLPTVVHTDRAGDRYRALTIEHVLRGETKTLREWKYTVDSKRGHFISSDEKEGLKREILALIEGIQEDRFVEAYEAFTERHPEGDLGAHALHAHSVRVMFFDDRNPKYAADHLKADGNIAYVGIHVYPEQYSDARFPKPWLFEALGIETIDANDFYIGTPYNPVRSDLPPGRRHPQAGLTDPLPDISAPGQRDGGLAYYANLAYRGDGWSAEYPGFYPHDGKTVATDLDPEILQFSTFEVTHSRPR